MKGFVFIDIFYKDLVYVKEKICIFVLVKNCFEIRVENEYYFLFFEVWVEIS